MAPELTEAEREKLDAEILDWKQRDGYWQDAQKRAMQMQMDQQDKEMS